MSPKVKRQGLPDTLAESLRERILNGELKEGEALILNDLAKGYDVSGIVDVASTSQHEIPVMAAGVQADF